jgi:hypothetical protein
MRICTTLLIGMFSFGVPGWLEPTMLSTIEPTPLPAFEAPMLPPDPQDMAVFEEKTRIAMAEQNLAERTLAVAKSFLGTPYVSGTLGTNTDEQLIVNLRALDCWTFMETSLATALAAGTPDPSFDTLKSYIQQLRYWGGTINGFASRIHYFSGWLLQAEKIGYLRDITSDLGGIPYRNKIGYMTARPGKYPPLKDPKTLHQMQQVEKRLNQHAWFFIPQNRIDQIESQLRDGDLIALTSGKSDLDIAHQGFAVRQNGRIHLLHASSLGRRVLISTQPLGQYVRAQKGQTGIMVARLVMSDEF